MVMMQQGVQFMEVISLFMEDKQFTMGVKRHLLMQTRQATTLRVSGAVLQQMIMVSGYNLLSRIQVTIKTCKTMQLRGQVVLIIQTRSQEVGMGIKSIGVIQTGD